MTNQIRESFGDTAVSSYLTSYMAEALPATRDVDPMLVWCWPSVRDDEPTLKQNWVNIVCCLAGEAVSTLGLLNRQIIIFHLF